jgi:hypothetical protein
MDHSDLVCASGCLISSADMKAAHKILEKQAYDVIWAKVLAAITFLKRLIWFHCNDQAACTIRHWCDNDSLIQETQSIRGWKETANSLKPEADLLKAIVNTARGVHQRVRKYKENRWVRGHQEDTVPFELLPLEAQLNVEADELTTAAIMGTLKKDTVLQAIHNPYCHAYLLNDNTVVTRNEKEILETKWKGAIM